jgi:hypothetical protein
MSAFRRYPSVKGPLSQENWKLALQHDGMCSCPTYEFPLFSDAWFTGEIPSGLGPYAFLNLINVRRRFGLARPAVVLRVEMHLSSDELPDMSKTDHGQYHGGTFADEIAAVGSLLLGVRLKAGGVSRVFEAKGDPRGRPIAWDQQPEPTLRPGRSGAVLASVGNECALNPLRELAHLPAVGSDAAVAFVRSSRLIKRLSGWPSRTRVSPGCFWCRVSRAPLTSGKRAGARQRIAFVRRNQSWRSIVTHLGWTACCPGWPASLLIRLGRRRSLSIS